MAGGRLIHKAGARKRSPKGNKTESFFLDCIVVAYGNGKEMEVYVCRGHGNYRSLPYVDFQTIDES